MTETLSIPVNWTFERADIARNFDRHVRSQLPWYDLVTGAMAHLARHYIPQNGLVYDIGASTGNVGRALEATLLDRRANLVGIESSADMIPLYHAPGEIVHADAREYPYDPFDVAILFLTLMFVPVVYRVTLLDRLRRRLKRGGAIIVVDKCQAVTGYVATVLWRMTLAGKVAAGVNANDIVAKELSLGGVQRPIDPRHLGDDAVEWFRFGEFAGWIIEG